MMKFYKILFTNSLILGTLISISSYSWLSMWMGLEINLLSMIPLMSSTNNSYSTEAAMKYFLTQALASMILMFSIITMLSINEMINMMLNKPLLVIMNSALLTKLGAAPFHFWFPEVMEGLSWNNCFLLLTWQKIAPMILIMNNSPHWIMMTIIILASVIVGGILGMNQVSLRKIMAFSSINHIGWLLAATTMFPVWTWYFSIYTLLTLNIVLMLKWTHSFFLKQIFNAMNNNKMIKFSFMSNFLSLGGLPPFLGFLPKWLVINSMIMNNQQTLLFFMVIMTLISLFVYLRIMFNSAIIMNTETKIKLNSTKSFIIFSINLTSSILIILSTVLFNLI
uniref:NADH-ubiquinone oxidoreductase chain 2 n=1 Tax=Mordella atrata TaxID=633874 RepID=C8YXE3_9CUCU|nr:NADH dehydrogenase subunit 2 [Mordella atrata]ACO92577.1 NADH dehydrogenase subunit 2 [Mordella atrata]